MYGFAIVKVILIGYLGI